MYIINNESPIYYNLSLIISNLLNSSIYDSNSNNLTYFCNSYNLTLDQQDTWIDQISSGYRCGKYLFDNSSTKNITTTNNDTNNITNNNSNDNDISFTIFNDSGGNITMINYPCFKINETFDNNTLWTINIGRSILCGIQTFEADELILQSIENQEISQSSSNSDSNNGNGNRLTNGDDKNFRSSNKLKNIINNGYKLKLFMIFYVLILNPFL